MRRLFLILFLAFSAAAPAGAQQDEIRSAITSQFDAFRQDDFDRAFSFASPGIRSLFQTPENFGRMVQQGYPMVYRPAETRFLDLSEIDGRLWQRVEVLDGAGRRFYLGYQMIPTENGWKINAVTLLDPPGASV
ncbi:DUF4864 domain-containing protein [Albibacillus kandeliae]|uniref:DUF4864 domain-containing protein n=1 Tax=Albibacillus kandeliae TaxID=2174228 RepID=UPI000D68DE4B|nr:DUF4864 domain-containing protein [Albibacillus kandeliae]